MKHSFPIALVLVYALIANLLAARAFRYRINTEERPRGYQIWYSRFFTPEGLRIRRWALSFIVLGGIAVLAVWFL